MRANSHRTRGRLHGRCQGAWMRTLGPCGCGSSSWTVRGRKPGPGVGLHPHGSPPAGIEPAWSRVSQASAPTSLRPRGSGLPTDQASATPWLPATWEDCLLKLRARTLRAPDVCWPPGRPGRRGARFYGEQMAPPHTAPNFLISRGRNDLSWLGCQLHSETRVVTS